MNQGKYKFEGYVQTILSLSTYGNDKGYDISSMKIIIIVSFEKDDNLKKSTVNFNGWSGVMYISIIYSIFAWDFPLFCFFIIHRIEETFKLSFDWP